MAKTINIVNGSGSDSLINGSYTVSAVVNGYDNTSINPSSVTIESGVNTYAFTVSANGTLTLHVSEDGTSAGTAIVGATFIRCDSQGNEYGSVITSNQDGDAVFNNVPYAASSAPTIYYKQTASDGNHEFDNTLQSIVMTTQTQSAEVTNAPGATRSITLTDSNYANLPIDSATLTLTNS